MQEALLSVTNIAASQWRVIMLAAMLMAGFVALAPSQVSAADDSPVKKTVEEICEEDGGIYWETEDDYGCYFPGGETVECNDLLVDFYGFNACVWNEDQKLVDDPISTPDPLTRAPADQKAVDEPVPTPALVTRAPADQKVVAEPAPTPTPVTRQPAAKSGATVAIEDKR
jgi:hypothetical protein